jgi:hypothetical protein
VDGEVDRAIHALGKGPKGITPFHWELEFPEVFTTNENGQVTGGFDVIVGNPPFMGGSKLSTAAGALYVLWLAIIHEGSRGKSDLVAHFFRRAFALLRKDGTLGMIATNTIRRGDTRETGLLWLREHGGSIYKAESRKTWPGEAAVVISVVHIAKSCAFGSRPVLNNQAVNQITAYLFHMGPDASPATLRANRPLVHSGTNINGEGFVLTPQLREQFIVEDPKCARHIRPYLGAEDMNDSPTATARRFAIFLEGLDEDSVKQFPVLYRHLYDSVRLQRQQSAERRLRECWWLYSRPATDLYSACKGVTRILASGRHGLHLSFAFQSTDTIFSDALTCFIFDRYYGFAILQSRIHELWATFFGSSLGDALRYIPEDCFETFALPQNCESNSTLECIGDQYYHHRAALMERYNHGLTTTYNRFHDPEEQTVEICKLRELHDQMDRAVIDAYGWVDVQPRCQFIPQFEDEDDGDENGRQRNKKYRYRWPDEIRDEVLARLLDLNRQRALEEGQLIADLAESAPSKTNGRKKKRAADAATAANGPLFATQKGVD